MKIFHINLTILTAAALVLLFSCGQDKPKVESKSMEQIRAEEGIPVKVENVQSEKFTKYLEFFSTVSGIKETTKMSSVGDRVEKVKVNVGDHVNEGDVVIEFPINNPAVQYDQAKLGYENAKTNYDRIKNLYDAGETSKANLDGIKTQYLVSKRNFEALKQMLFVEAPISGTIIDLMVKEGDDIGKNKPLFKIAQLNKVKAKLWATGEEIEYLKVGQPATLGWNGFKVSGRVTEIAMAMDDRMRAFAVEAVFPNQRKEIKSGITVNVKIKIYENDAAFILPRKLIQHSDKGNFIYIVDNNTAAKKYIETGFESGINVEIKSGLKENDEVITQGTSLLEEGSKLKILD